MSVREISGWSGPPVGSQVVLDENRETGYVAGRILK